MFRCSKQALMTYFFKPVDQNGRAATDQKLEEKGIAAFDREKDAKEIRRFNKENQKEIASANKYKQWNGYAFFATNNYSEYSVRTMATKIDLTNKCLYGNDYEVATACVDEDSALTHIWVKEAFRHHGIGTELIRFINGCCQQFTVFAGKEKNSRYRLTEDGYRLIASCEKKGILKTDQIIWNYVPPSPTSSYSTPTLSQ